MRNLDFGSANVGLALFLLAQALIFAALGLDASLMSRGLPSITHRVWADPWLGAPLLAVLALAFLGLAMHFYGK